MYVIVKDSSKVLRVQLTDDEIRKYASHQYLEHMAKKHSREISSFQHKDALFETAASHKPDYSKNIRPERGIKINVGGPSIAR